MTTKAGTAMPASMARRDLAERLATAGWGLFFIWTGVVLLAEMRLGIGLLGAGIIALAGQTARMHFGLRLRRFWLVIASLLVLSGLWEILARDLQHVPILLLLFGVLLILGVMRPRQRHRRDDESSAVGHIAHESPRSRPTDVLTAL